MKKGLSTSQALKKQQHDGLNVLTKKKSKSLFIYFLEQFKDLMVILLLIATIFSYSMAIFNAVQINWLYSTELLITFIEPSIILLVVVINAIIGTVQEVKSQQAVAALSKLTPLKVKVYRDNIVQYINSKELVVGDVVIIESGDIVPADGILLTASNLQLIETSLTGESEPVIKQVGKDFNFELPIGDQFFKVFSSTMVATGSAEFEVTQIGMSTEIGKISSMINKEEDKLTPLQFKINKLGRIFGYSGLALFGLTVLMQIVFQLINKVNLNNSLLWTTNIINGISLAVAAIPEGLVAFTTIILALSVQQMTKQKAIVKSLMAVETLGSTTIICSDKTGTLTQNKMTIVEYEVDNKFTFEQLLKFGSLASDAQISVTDNETHYVGDPTEIAIIQKAINLGIYQTKQELDREYKRLHVFPFDSERKMMSSINKIKNEYFLIVKGAPEILLNSTKINTISRKNVEKRINEWADRALRTLAFAVKKITAEEAKKYSKLDPQEIEKDLEFVGLVGMIDPPRESSKGAIAMCKRAGIRTIMITGDNVITAKAIAKDLGIYQNGDLAIEGIELDKMTDEELSLKLDHCSVFARVAPKDKLRLVKILQNKDNVVAMTGDGVNDAPALKAADIGCAMGITGTEVSKEAANMILVDDNFSTIVHAVEKGRNVYETIRSVIKNLLITSVAEIVLVFFGLLIMNLVFSQTIKANNIEIFILSPTQLLWINLFTHGFPAIALGLQKNNFDYMSNKPYSKNESIFARRMGIDVLWQGMLIGLLSLIGYYLAANYAIENNQATSLSMYGSGVAFMIIGVAAVLSSLNLMTDKPVIITNPLNHKLVYSSVIFSTFWLVIVVIVPNIAQVFKITTNLFTTPELVWITTGFIGLIYLLMELHKILIRYILKKQY